MFWLFLGVICGYLIGSFPTAVIVSKIFFGFDIRTRGSGNMGSTNVFRVLGAFWGILVQFIDILKGYIPVAFLSNFFAQYIDVAIFNSLGGMLAFKILIGLSAVLGHIFSVFVGFKGGKGVNTALGFVLAISPLEVGICLVVFLLSFLSTGMVSLGSILASFSYPLVILIRKVVFDYPYSNFSFLLTFSAILFLISLFTHRENIIRIIQGKENKFEKFHIIKFKKD